MDRLSIGKRRKRGRVPLGTEDVDGTAAHKLKVVRKNGDVSFVYLDPDHFLEIRIVTGRMRHGAYEEVETDWATTKSRRRVCSNFN